MALDFVAGCFGGCAGVFVGHPLDTIKVRLQTQDGFNPKYRGTWNCFSQTLRAESIRGLYKGMSSPMAGVSAINAIIFGVQGNLMRRIKNPEALRSHAITGGATGFIQAFITSPLELTKIRMQIQSNTVVGDSSALYKSPWHCLKEILKSEGVRGVFRGQTITVFREIPAFTIYFGTYEFLVRTISTEGKESSFLIDFVAGGSAGVASWVLTYPLDVVKTRLQADGIRGENKYKGIMHCFKSSVATEGLPVLSRGLNSTVIRAFPTNAATFTVVAWVKKFSEKNEVSSGDSAAWDDVIARGDIIVSSAAKPKAEIISTSTK